MEFLLRPWKSEDKEDLICFASNPKIADNLSDAFPYPFTSEAADSFLAQATSATPTNRMAIVIDNRAVGGTGIHPLTDIQRKNAEIGYWLGEPYWGKGIMSRVIPLMVDYSFKHFDIERIFARVFTSNPASARVLERAGFVQEAAFTGTLFKNNTFRDELIYAIRRTPPQAAAELKQEGRQTA